MNNVREETIKRTETLVNTFELNPNILKYFKGGQVYYSYTIFMGASASIDKISYDKEYEKAVQDFETEHKGYIVYHAIESISEQGKMLTLLYVSSDEEEWESERLADDSIKDGQTVEYELSTRDDGRVQAVNVTVIEDKKPDIEHVCVAVRTPAA